jgi:PilZ domain-containing protein
MSTQTQAKFLERRQSRRFDIKLSVDVVSDGQKIAFGMVDNLSREGAAVSVFPLLDIGRKYGFHLSGHGVWTGTVVRRFGVKSHGVRFNITESQKRRLDEVILSLSPDSVSCDEHEVKVADLTDRTIRAF